MRKILGFVVVGLLAAAVIPSMDAWGDCFYEWTFDMEAEGNIQVKVDVHLRDMDFGLSAWEMNYDRRWEEKITNMKAYESKTRKELDIELRESREILQYFFLFDSKNPGDDFDFTVEFDLKDGFVEIMEGVSYFEWSVACGENFMRHVMDVTLPSRTEALLISEAVPLDFAQKGGAVTIHFEEESKGMGIKIKMGVAFSGAGISYLKKAETAFNSQNYEEAQANYKSSITFYESLGVFYGMTSDAYLDQLEEDFNISLTPTYFQFSSKSEYDQFLKQLREKKTFCGEKIEELKETSKEAEANELFSKATGFFNFGDYEKAQDAFIEAQDLYRSMGNTEKVSECQDFIDQCSQLLEKEAQEMKAEGLFSEGKSLSEQQQYGEAKSKFEEALTLYEELGDDEKSQECREWITSCEEAQKPPEGGFCLGSLLLVFMVCAGISILTRR
ncbi:MAG: hypothetical protein HXS44_01935 [Theionarchaea archaeon]|nr:hypothetical protein [Theionarchaea archaeon]